ncbi:MAG: AEC family transporter, partial [Oscillospiraceae bacterium]|nr:AEC family transporter [Oscillospiraceae bacterium]
MNDLIFSINVVLPLFMIMLAGFALKKINIVGEKAAGQVNKIVFRLLLPCYMISSISKMDLAENFNVSFMAFTLLLVLAVIGLCFLVFPLLVK